MEVCPNNFHFLVYRGSMINLGLHAKPRLKGNFLFLKIDNNRLETTLVKKKKKNSFLDSGFQPFPSFKVGFLRRGILFFIFVKKK